MKRLFDKDVPFITYIIHDKNMKNRRTVTVYKPTQEYYILFELIKFRRLPATFPDIGITVISEGLEPSPSDVSVTEDVLTTIKTPRSIENNNPDYYKAAEKTALVRLCGVLGVLTENNDLATAALLAATRIERLEKKIPALNIDLAEASMHAYNGEVARMKLEAENAELKADLKNKNTRIAELEAEIDQLTAHDAAERQDDKWIPISENPTKSDWYLIMYQGYRVPDADYYDVEAGWLSDIPIPDYWMPLPELPEEVK